MKILNVNRVSTMVGDWFTRAMAHPGESRYVQLGDVPIHYLSWGQEGRPVVLLVHGFRAHARWWDFIAPLLADEYRVVALDLSGMGESGRRKAYRTETFAQDIIAVIKALNVKGVTIIGHSFGGGCSLRAAVEAPDLIDYVVVIDSYLHFPDHPPVRKQTTNTRKAAYGDFDEACRRFRLTPGQPCALPQIMEHLAKTSLRRVDGGWDWKFDPDLPLIVHDARELALFSQVKARVDVIHGQFSNVMDSVLARRVADLLCDGRAPIEIPEGHHHIMVSQPLALVSALRVLLAGACIS